MSVSDWANCLFRRVEPRHRVGCRPPNGVAFLPATDLGNRDSMDGYGLVFFVAIAALG
jgi:hypothetical protein